MISLNTGDFPTDRDRIHLSLPLGQSVQTTFLYIDKGSVGDTALPPNYLPPIPKANATQIYTLTLDAVPPALVSYTLDMTAHKLVLYFS